MDIDPAKTNKMIQAYLQKRVILGEFQREKRFKALLKEHNWKVKVWTLTTVTSGISVLFFNVSRYFKGFLVFLWAFASFFLLPKSNEFLVVSNQLYDKYEKMMQTELPLTKKLSARKANKQLHRMFGI